MSAKDWKSWNRKNRKYHLQWQRRWRANEENRLHEQALCKLREAVRAGITTFDVYMNEVRKPGMVKFRRPA